MEEGRTAGQPGDQDEYVFLLVTPAHASFAVPAWRAASASDVLIICDSVPEKQLLEMISFQIQMLKPDNVPKAPYNADPAPQTTEPPAPSTPLKGKQPAKGGSKATSVSNTTISPSPDTKRPAKVPSPPQPWPQLTSRVSPYSPALPSGVLIETVKAGMSAEAAPGIGGGGGGGGGGKGKRKIVRVRG